MSQGRFWLAPDIHYVAAQDRILIAGERSVLEVSGAGSRLAGGIAALRSGATCDELTSICGPLLAHQLMSRLAESGWLVTECDEAARSGQFGQVVGWFASKTSRPLSAMARLSSARVAIMGVGGLGTQVIEHLAGSGLGQFVLIDGDVVEPSNLNRQYMFDHGCIGRLKVAVAAERIVARNPAADIKTYPLFLATAADLATLDGDAIDVFVNCADRPLGIDQTIAGYCARRGLPFVTAGVGLNRGYWGPFLITGTTCNWHTFISSLQDALPGIASAVYGSAACTSSFGPFNSIIGSFLAADVVRYCSNIAKPASLGRRMFVDFDAFRVSSFPDESRDPVAARVAPVDAATKAQI